MKIYARQINPAYQESPFFKGDLDEAYSGLVIDGNRSFNSHTTAEYDLIRENLEDMLYYYSEDNTDNLTVAEFLDDYGFSYTDDTLPEWGTMFEEGYYIFDRERDDTTAWALTLLTGDKWEYTTIKGSSQSDWQGCYYNTSLWSADSISNLAKEYFNEGTEWIIHDDDGEPETAEDIEGYSMYCYGYSTDKIREEIAAETGVNPEDVVLYEYHEKTVPYYEVA